MNYVTSEYENLTVVSPSDCGNAPKKLLLRDFHVAVVKKDNSFITENLMENCHWDFIGREQIDGIENIVCTLGKIYTSKPLKIVIEHIITHGKKSSINGSLTLENNETYSFCHVHVFNSAGKQAKIKEISSYIMNTTSYFVMNR